MKVLYAPQLPWLWTAPDGEFMLLAGPMYILAGMRVNPATNGYHGDHGGTSPRLVRVEDGTTLLLGIPERPVITAGPKITEGEGASARSTYEALNLLGTVQVV